MSDIMHVNNPSVTLSANSSTSASVAFPTRRPAGLNIKVYNSGNTPVYIRSGISSVAAAAGDGFVSPNAVEVFRLSDGDTHLAALTAGGSAILYIQMGAGV